MNLPDVSRRTVLAGGLAAAAVASSGRAASASGAAFGVMAPDGQSTKGWVNSTLARMTLEEKLGQLFVQYAYGATADTEDARNVTLFGVKTPAEVVKKYRLGGIIYFAWTDSVANPEQILGLSNGLQTAALKVRSKVKIPLTIATDQEMGVVTRVGPPATQFPGNMALGAGRSAADARTAAAITGQELRAIGINTNFAPDADVNVNALNPVIGTRSFSSDPALVAELVRAQVAGYQREGKVCSSAKHFPGHGDTATDSHVAFPIITHTREEWEQIDAPPFKAAIAEGIDMIMTAHLNFPALDDSGDPATLSKPVMTGLLREHLGFEGVIITDSLEMQGVRDLYSDGEVAVRALVGGVDQLLMTPKIDEAMAAIKAALASGRLTMQDIDAKVRRILTMKHRRGIASQPIANPNLIPKIVGTPAHLAAADDLTNRTPTLVKNDAKALPLTARGKKIMVTGYGVVATDTLSAALTERGATVTKSQTGAAPTDAVVNATIAAAASVDTVVVLTMKAWDTKVTDKNGGQQKLVKGLLATGKTVIVVAVRDPYDIAYFTSAPAYVATYSYNAVSMNALARVLVGEVKPVGTLPVMVPVAGAPTTALYPFGHGLSY